MGGGELPSLPWNEILRNVRQRVVAVSRGRTLELPGEEIAQVKLDRELRPEEIAEMEADERKDRYRSMWIITISLLVTVIGISNAMLMSVTERFREIGTMKCLGALSAFVRFMFLIESGFMGVVGG
ncbi:MAG: FtsX-like permease family protein, partial [Chitinivibrionales bacterium]|nr:FtsX-like permease family protein [Chitinivibrionales bacterium]